MLRSLSILGLVLLGACASEEDASEREAERTRTVLDASGLMDLLDARVANGPGPRLEDAASPARDAARVSDSASAAAPDSAHSLCALLASRAGVALPDRAGISWAELLCETVDLDRLTHLPATPFVSRMASSYNRGSTHESGPGWFANGDFSAYLRDQGDEHVMMEATGPGVITRLWTPKPSGHIRIYIDDPDTPALDVPMAALFSGSYQLPWGAPFVFEAAEGYNSYFPIPYASYVRVSTTSNDLFYYQVDSRAYADGTQVETFSPAGLAALAPLAHELTAVIADPTRDPRLLGLSAHSIELTPDAPTQTATLGPALIRELVVQGFDTARDSLRTTRLILTVDGERVVDAPLGDLFGAGPGLLPYRSLVASISTDALTLRWPMPVGSTFAARVESSTTLPAKLTLRLRYAVTPPPPLRFFARWTGAHTFSSRTAEDWTVLHYRGAGWYVGTVLNVGNPTNLWWGEGDEKIFVDGETFPSHFGTGTEDYFGMGWCSTEVVARPWLGQTRADGPANAGRTSVYRWHVGDALPFQSELRFRLEVLHWLNGVADVALTQDAVAYWYALPGGTDEQTALPTSAFAIPALSPVTVPTLPGASTCKL